MKIGIMGPGRSGKDEAAKILVDEFGFRYAGSTSVVISREIARREGITFEEAHAQRHDRRDEWYRVGNELRANDPAALVRSLWNETDLIVGVRDREEMAESRDWFDMVFWVDRPGVPFDPTLKFGPEWAHVIVPNRSDVFAYRGRWRVIGKLLAGIRSWKACGPGYTPPVARVAETEEELFDALHSIQPKERA